MARKREGLSGGGGREAPINSLPLRPPLPPVREVGRAADDLGQAGAEARRPRQGAAGEKRTALRSARMTTWTPWRDYEAR